jgi:hypothetical protein
MDLVLFLLLCVYEENCWMNLQVANGENCCLKTEVEATVKNVVIH